MSVSIAYKGSQRQRAQVSPIEFHLERFEHRMADETWCNCLQRGVWNKQS